MKTRVHDRPRPFQQRGYNLVEVLIAMAMLSMVLLGVVTLFVMGQRNVYSGKQMTRAVAMGTRIMEDFTPLTRASIENAFGLGAETPGTVTVAGKTYADSVLRTTATDSGDATKDANGYLDKWDDFLVQEQFNDGEVKLVISAIDPLTAPPTFTDAPIYRVRVFVEWNEGTRQRRVALDTVKVDRTK